MKYHSAIDMMTFILEDGGRNISSNFFSALALITWKRMANNWWCSWGWWRTAMTGMRWKEKTQNKTEIKLLIAKTMIWKLRINPQNEWISINNWFDSIFSVYIHSNVVVVGMRWPLLNFGKYFKWILPSPVRPEGHCTIYIGVGFPFPDQCRAFPICNGLQMQLVPTIHSVRSPMAIDPALHLNT